MLGHASCDPPGQYTITMEPISSPVPNVKMHVAEVPHMDNNLRQKLKKDSRATLIHEWDQANERYRLLAVGMWSAGYEDSYVIERLSSDALGEPRWDTLFKWKATASGDEFRPHLLIGAIQSLVKGL